jgi:arginyl-tRNA synthetase
VICGPDGKRFKSRSGETVRLVDLLDASVTRMKESLQERKAEGKTDLTDEEIEAAASKIGYGAVK